MLPGRAGHGRLVVRHRHRARERRRRGVVRHDVAVVDDLADGVVGRRKGGLRQRERRERQRVDHRVARDRFRRVARAAPAPGSAISNVPTGGVPTVTVKLTVTVAPPGTSPRLNVTTPRGLAAGPRRGRARAERRAGRDRVGHDDVVRRDVRLVADDERVRDRVAVHDLAGRVVELDDPEYAARSRSRPGCSRSGRGPGSSDRASPVFVTVEPPPRRHRHVERERRRAGRDRHAAPRHRARRERAGRRAVVRERGARPARRR